MKVLTNINGENLKINSKDIVYKLSNKGITLDTFLKGQSYSTEEIFTGKYWIDGKKIYRKVINFGVIGEDYLSTFSHNVEIDSLISAVTKIESSTSCIFLPFDEGSDVVMKVSHQSIKGTKYQLKTLRQNKDFWSNWEIISTIEYTKTSN